VYHLNPPPPWCTDNCFITYFDYILYLFNFYSNCQHFQCINSVHVITIRIRKTWKVESTHKLMERLLFKPLPSIDSFMKSRSSCMSSSLYINHVIVLSWLKENKEMWKVEKQQELEAFVYKPEVSSVWVWQYSYTV